MKPDEHEYKVMGLAPYAKDKYVDEIYPVFKDMLWVDGLKLNSNFRMQYADSCLNEKMKYKRFDNVAGAVQRLVEELMTEWVKNAIKQTGITSIAIAGGVGMNVKANQKISEIPEVTDIYCMPSSGDESTALGCCFYGYLKNSKNNQKNDIQPLTNLYLGPEYSDEEINKFLIENMPLSYNLKRCDNIEKEIASLLANDEIVARFKGRSEWGARALGNRSILANPSNRDNLRIINEIIKSRDFWMPFTPSILEEDVKKYIANPKKISCPFMIVTFNSTKKARKDLAAAMHPYDFTIRPQSVSAKESPDYHRLISYFKKKTGIGAVLNTSFNLHGEPNVLSPKDAMHTFESSGLKYLAMGNYLIKKEEKKEDHGKEA
jgi:carbamoyltransferase